MRLYHRTTPEVAHAILSTQQFRSKMNTGEIYASNMLHGQAQGFGSGVVELDVPDERAELNDEFPNGEKHYAINPRYAKVVRSYEDEPTPEETWGKS